MQVSRFIATAMSLVWAGALVGCAGSSPFGAPPADAFSTANGFDNPNRQPYEQLAQAFPQQNVVGPSGSRMPAQPPQTSESGWLASVRKAGSAIGDAFSLSPPTIPANDPTSLSQRPPEHVGGSLNYHAAKVYETQGNVAGAMALYQKTLQMSPNDVKAMISYARLLDREGNFREAERQYQQALQIEPTNAIVLNDLGMVYGRQGMYEQAIAPLTQAVQLQPTNQRYRNNIAIVLVDAGRPEEAHQQLAQVHGEAVAHYNVGYLLSKRNENDQATWHLQQAVAKNPQLVSAQQLLDSIAQPPSATPPSFHQQPNYAQQQPQRQVQQPVGYDGNATFAPASDQYPTTRPLPPL